MLLIFLNGAENLTQEKSECFFSYDLECVSGMPQLEKTL